jgi:hypothetical protein
MSINEIEKDLLLINTGDASPASTAEEEIADDTVPLNADEVSTESLTTCID